MKKTRILTLTLVFMLIASLLTVTGCAAPTPTPTPSPIPTPTLVPKTDYGATLAYKGKLTYLIWGGEIDMVQEKLKVDLFRSKYPDITVDIVQQSGAWPDILAARQADGTFPDLFWNPDVSGSIITDYVADLSMFKDDTDYEKWNKNLVSMAQYGTFQAAMPNKYFTSGVYINKTLLEQNNIDMPSVDWSYADMTNIIKDLAATGADLRACAWPMWNGIFVTPSGLYRNIKEGKDFDFGDPENIKVNQFRYEQFKLSNDYLKPIDGKDYWFDSGKVGIMDDMSWGIGWYALESNEGKGLAFDWDYYPLPALEPGGQQYQLAIADFISVGNIAMSDKDRAVSQTEKDKLTAAYVLLKYLCINEEGYLQALAKSFNSLPVFESETAVTAFKATYKIPGKPGFSKVMEMMNDTNAMVVEPAKFIPGTSSAFWDAYFNICLTNEQMGKTDYIATIQQKATDMNTKAKQTIVDASVALAKALKDNWDITWTPSK